MQKSLFSSITSLTSLGSSWVTQVSSVQWSFWMSSCNSLQPDVFPEMEILWLLTRAWNTGILLYSLAQYPEAERWCSLAMSFIRHLGTLQESYEKQVQYWRWERGRRTECGVCSSIIELCGPVWLSLWTQKPIKFITNTEDSFEVFTDVSFIPTDVCAL